MTGLLRALLVVLWCLGLTQAFSIPSQLQSALPRAAVHRGRGAQSRLCMAAARNSAVVFVKPHAVNPDSVAFVRNFLTEAGLEIAAETSVDAEEIEAKRIIDQHYGTLAVLAMEVDPGTLDPSSEVKAKFQDLFGADWDSADFRTNPAALEACGANALELEAMWRAGPFLKLAPGTYVAKLEGTEGDGIFTLNGFYPAMRAQFVNPGAKVHVFVVEFDEEKCPWEQFRASVIGATDPTKAAPGSLRQEVLHRWKELGLGEEPSMAKNGVHASAGPLEGLKERIVWTKAKIEDDSMGKVLLQDLKIDQKLLSQWLEQNPVVETQSSGSDKIFDLTENMDTSKVLEFLQTEVVV